MKKEKLTNFVFLDRRRSRYKFAECSRWTRNSFNENRTKIKYPPVAAFNLRSIFWRIQRFYRHDYSTYSVASCQCKNKNRTFVHRKFAGRYRQRYESMQSECMSIKFDWFNEISLSSTGTSYYPHDEKLFDRRRNVVSRFGTNFFWNIKIWTRRSNFRWKL